LGHDLNSQYNIIDDETNAVIAQISDNFTHYQETLIDWCEHNTGSRNYEGLRLFLSKLEKAFAPLGAQITRYKLDDEKIVLANGEIIDVDLGHSLLITQRPKAPIQIVLTGHYDTVFGIDSQFQKVTDKGDENIYGPGVADMKGGILAMLTGLLAFESHPKKSQIGYNILLSPDEEIGSLGSNTKIMELGRNADLGLTFEPALADGSMAGARKGSANYALIIHGIAAHVGRAHHEGRSAIKAAAQFVCAIEEINNNAQGIIINTGKIDGGGANNIVPDLAIVRFNVRADTPQQMDKAIEFIKKSIHSLCDDNFHCHLEGGISRPPKPLNRAQSYLFNDIGKIAQDLKMNWQIKDTGGVCEGNNLFAAGCPNIDTLGVCGGLIHSPQEFAVKSSFGERAKFLAAILGAYSNGILDAKAPKKLMGDI
jgi:glutamate carboxypeptidase